MPVFALHETCVVAIYIPSTACCATVVAEVICKLHPFVLVQGFFAVQTAWEKCVYFRCRVANKPVIKCFCFLANTHQYNARGGRMRGMPSQAMLFTKCIYNARFKLMNNPGRTRGGVIWSLRVTRAN